MFRHDIGEPVRFLALVLVCVFMCLCTYDQDVVELLHSVDLGQQLVDHGVVDSRAARHASTLLTDRVDLIKYDDVKTAVGAKLFNRENRTGIINENTVYMYFKCTFKYYV